MYKKDIDLVCKPRFFEFWRSGVNICSFETPIAKTRSTCEQNFHWCGNFQHVQGQTSFVNTVFFEFWRSGVNICSFETLIAKTRSTCEQNFHWCGNFQHVQEQTLLCLVWQSFARWVRNVQGLMLNSVPRLEQACVSTSLGSK